MKLKLDENLGRRGLDVLTSAGHDVAPVRGEGLGGAADEDLFAVCQAERRVLVTLDHDFGHVLRFPPEQSAGIVILEPGSRVSPRAILDRVRDLASLLQSMQPAGTLWIVEPGRVRVHRRDEAE